jgi:hypothetical protein
MSVRMATLISTGSAGGSRRPLIVGRNETGRPWAAGLHSDFQARDQPKRALHLRLAFLNFFLAVALAFCSAAPSNRFAFLRAFL